MSRLLERFFLTLCAREMLILLGLAVILAAIPVLLEQGHFLRTFWGALPGHDEVEEMERLIDGLAGVLVAGGVFLESRETLRKMALHHAAETTNLQLQLNEVAHHNGMGLLLVGLFMEIGTALVGMPTRVVDVRGAEKYVFAVCCVLTVAALVILLDFLKDYVRTYFGRTEAIRAE